MNFMEQNPFEKPIVSQKKSTAFLMETEKDSLLCAQEPTVGQNILWDQAKLFVTWKVICFLRLNRNDLEYLILRLWDWIRKGFRYGKYIGAGIISIIINTQRKKFVFHCYQNIL
jgi:hypothetical protein